MQKDEESAAIVASSLGDNLISRDGEIKRPMSPSAATIPAGVDEFCTCVGFLTCQDPETTRTDGMVDEVCTCVEFLTCQDPEHYDVDDDICDSNGSQQRNVTLSGTPQPDPPESHTVLVQRTRYNNNNETSSLQSSIYDEANYNITTADSFDIIVHTPSRQQQQQQKPQHYDDKEQNSTTTPNTSSTVRRTKPEEYEPLIMIVDDEEQLDSVTGRNNDNKYDNSNRELSPKSNTAVRDTSSTSSLQYHRRSPMFLSYASPHQSQQQQQQQQQQYRRYDNDKTTTNTTEPYENRHEMVQSLIRNELSKRYGRSSSSSNGHHLPSQRTDGYSIQYNRYSTLKNRHSDTSNMNNTIRNYSTTSIHNNQQKIDMDRTDQCRFHRNDSNNSNQQDHHHHHHRATKDAVSSVGSSELLNHYHLQVQQGTTLKQGNYHRTSHDTDTVRAVAPNKITVIDDRNDDDDTDINQPDRTDQVIVIPRITL